MTSRDPERSGRDPNTLRVQYREKQLLSIIANECCEAVRSAILATAWVLVYVVNVFIFFHLTVYVHQRTAPQQNDSQ